MENTGQKNSDYTQITYITDGITRVFCGKNCWVEFDFPPSVLTKITIKERIKTEQKEQHVDKNI